MKIPFVKLHGAKNDFLLTPMEDAPATGLPEIAIAICNRYTGVGADGWMLIANIPGEGYDAAIRLFNSDGSEPELSGNGTRCAAALLARDQPAKNEFRIKTGAGIKHLKLISHHGNEYQFEMNMGDIKVLELHATVKGRDAVLVDAGNPQCAFPVTDFNFDWKSVGEATERDAMFPNRTNVSFIRPIDQNTIEVRFWERGAGETNSSGTGSTGAAVAAQARGLAQSPMTVQTPAGPLILTLTGDEVKLKGPAELVSEGAFYLTNLS